VGHTLGVPLSPDLPDAPAPTLRTELPPSLTPPAAYGSGRVPDDDATAHLWPGPRHTGTELNEIGRDVRQSVPRRAHETLELPADRDPLAILARQEERRVPELVPVRHSRMAVSPFTFFRGAAAVMAADLATTPTTPLHVQLCGDAHLLNFGAFGTPERHLAFDVNDFDETLPGPFEWDVKRLAASVVVAARDRGFRPGDARAAALAAALTYQSSMASLAAMSELDCWYTHLNVDELLPDLPKQARKRTEQTIDKARRRTSVQAAAKLTTTAGGRMRIVEDPPLIVRLDDPLLVDHLNELFGGYRLTLPSDRRHLLDRYRVVDVARKVVGVGSVGTRCYIVLLAANSDGSPLFLQVKEAEASVLEPYVGRAAEPSGGERVVAGQRLMQATTDIFLGWGNVEPYHFYLRQLRDMKGSADVDTMTPEGLRAYAEVCGFALARAHARSGSADAITAYLGSKPTFADAISRFADAYADVNEADYAAFTAAIADGRLEAAERY
jgi:uncharacterized protein (DUF2252 family)